MELAVLFVVGLFGFYLIVLPILVFTARGRLNRVEAEAAKLREELTTLRTRSAVSPAAGVAESEAGRPPVPSVSIQPALSAAGLAGVPGTPASPEIPPGFPVGIAD